MNGIHPNVLANTNCMNEVMRWFADEQNPVIVKICAAALSVFAIFALTRFFHPLLSVLVIAPLSLWAWREWTLLSTAPANPHQWFDPTDMLAEQGLPFHVSWQRMRNILGGREAFEMLPRLQRLHVDDEEIIIEKTHTFISQDLPNHFAIMVHISGSILVKVRDADQGGRLLVISFFDDSTEEAPGRWSHNIDGVIQSSDDALMQADLLRQITVDRNHPRYSLA